MTSTSNSPSTQEANMAASILSSQLVGDFSRFKLVEFQTRFGAIEWIVNDAHHIDPATHLPETIGQCNTKAEAMAIIAKRETR